MACSADRARRKSPLCSNCKQRWAQVVDITVPRFGVLLRIAFGALLAILAMQPDGSRHSAEAPVALAIEDAAPRAGDLVLARKGTSAARVVERVTAELGASYDHTTAPSAAIVFPRQRLAGSTPVGTARL